jgi:hypothetical protein
MYPMQAPLKLIELRIERVAALFDPFDPFPIPSRDVSKTVEDFIVGWARELHGKAALQIVVHAPGTECSVESERQISDAFRRHFLYRSSCIERDLHDLFRVGRLSLLIGLGVLAGCVLISRLAYTFLGEGFFAGLLSEGILILGWVANWRPLEIFLYDWWPLIQHRRLLLRLAEARVELIARLASC